MIDALDSFQGKPLSWLVGEPGDPPPRELVEAMSDALDSSHHLYSPPAGLAELRRVIADDEGAPVAPEMITITQGAKSGLLVLLNALLEPGDEVIIPTPCYPAYPELVRLHGATPRPLEMGHLSYQVDLEDLDRMCTEATRAVLLSSPSNPTGATLSGGHAERLVSWCRDHKVLLISDEAYEAFRYVPEAPRTVAENDPHRETVVQLKSFSKTYNLCGWRIGYVVADEATSRRIAQRQSALVNPPSTPAQLALCRFPSVAPAYLEGARTRARRRLSVVGEALTRCGLDVQQPEGAFYLWFDIRDALEQGGWSGSTEWCEALAARHGVGLWPGDDYLAPGWVRCSAVACSDRALEASAALLEELLSQHLRNSR